MKKYFCDICGDETPELPCHDFCQWVQMDEVTFQGRETFFARFYVCDRCRDIWNNSAPEFIQAVKNLCNKRSTT